MTKVRLLPFITLLSLIIMGFIPFNSNQTIAQLENCDSSYPDFCIPPPPPDLNCADILDKRFTVLPPDPHGLDRDGDGIGCES